VIWAISVATRNASILEGNEDDRFVHHTKTRSLDRLIRATFVRLAKRHVGPMNSSTEPGLN
jgi:hypothetical protein